MLVDALQCGRLGRPTEEPTAKLTGPSCRVRTRRWVVGRMAAISQSPFIETTEWPRRAGSRCYAAVVKEGASAPLDGAGSIKARRRGGVRGWVVAVDGVRPVGR